MGLRERLTGVGCLKTALRAWALLCFFLIPQAAFAQLQYINTTDGTISETATPCTTPSVNPLLRTFSVGPHYTINDVNIGVLLSHTWRGDLIMHLTSPTGTRIQLFNATAGSADNFNVLLDDAAANPVGNHTANDTAAVATIVPPFQRTFRPVTALSAFNGEDASGTWTLEICDNANLDVGVFYQSNLQITARPATLTVSKASLVTADGVSAADFKAIPGATLRYCITITNTGPGLAAVINATDAIPAKSTYVSGSMRSGTTCTTAATVEDDNAADADESDPVGASISGTTISMNAPIIANGGVFVLTFLATIN